MEHRVDRFESSSRTTPVPTQSLMYSATQSTYMLTGVVGH